MHSGFADEDMDFTPRDADSWQTTRHLWIRHHLEQRRSLIMAIRKSIPLTSNLQTYRLPRVIPINKQPSDPSYHEQWEQVDLPIPHLIAQTLHMTGEVPKLFSEREYITETTGRYDSLNMPSTDEDIPIQQSAAAFTTTRHAFS